MNEAETRAELIDPALKAAGWGEVAGSVVRREYLTLGRLEGNGRRGARLKADYVLFYRNTRLAVIEAKAKGEAISAGLGQAKNYAELLQVRYTFSTNGEGVYLVDMREGTEGEVERFPTPDELWQETFAEANDWRNRFAEIPFEPVGGKFEERYYQTNAVENALKAIADGKDRILLTLATGTGKTFIAFQIIWKLFQSRWNLADWRAGREPTRRPRILFLSDRNILANQAFNDFSAFPEDALARISPAEIRKRGKVPKNASVFFTIFQTFMSGPAGSPYFGDYPEDFFDFVVIDECHRGGARNESNWRGIMEHFSPAVQLGLTATPKRKNNVDTYDYFGEPVYVYSLKEGINDGFLTPFRMPEIETDIDEYEYETEDEILEGEIEEGRVYSEADMNRVIEIKQREQYRVKVFMDMIDRNEKTLVFCATQLHALAVRDLINKYKTSTESHYCVRVTADDGALGEKHLKTFRDNEEPIPTILTTSRKLSTGVDARNIRNIVLLREIKDIIEFKQIIGRGTRLFEGKDYFSVYDFVNAHDHFKDPEWDGNPIAQDPCDECGRRPCVCVRPGPKLCEECGMQPCECVKPPCEECGESPCQCKRKIVKVKLSDGRFRNITHRVKTTFWHPDGTPMTAQDFLTTLFGKLPEFFQSEDELRTLWSSPDTRKKLLNGLSEKGFGAAHLAEMARIIDAEKSDIFDVLSYVAWSLEPLTREQRAFTARVDVSANFNEKQAAFLDFVLTHYVNQGVHELDPEKLTPLLELKYASIADAIEELGRPEEIGRVFAEFQRYLYPSAALAK